MPTSRTLAPLDYRPSYLAAAIAAAAVFGLYVFTLGPSTAMWDTSEYIAAAYTMGLPHPPGNPFFVLLGRVFSILPIAPNIAMRINLLAALSSAVTAGFWFLIAERVLATWLAERWQRIAGGALASLIGATAFTVWAQSVVNEKVYTVALVGIAIVSWLAVRWCDDPDAKGADKLLVLAAYVMGLGYANHMAGVLTLPALGAAILLRRPRTLLRWKLILACAGALALGATPFATQPIRSAHFPAINEGETTGCADKIAVSCTLSAETYDRFMYNFNRKQYGKPDLSVRQAPFSAQIGMWWLYFKWQWLRDPGHTNGGPQTALAVLFFGIGLLGAWVHFRRDRASFVYFGPLMATLTIVLIYYLNFRYGASQADSAFCNSADPSPCEVRDRDYFFLWSFSAWSVWASLGLMYAWESVAALIGADTKTAAAKPATTRRLGWALASPVLILAFIPLMANWHSASRRGDTDTADWARDLLNSVEPYGILVTAGDNDMFPLWYAQQVEGVRRDVVLANTSLMNTQWYVRQMIRQPVFAYNPDTGPALYRDKVWPKPTGPVLKMSYQEADSIPDMSEITQDMQFVSGELKTTVTPRILMRSDWLVYRLIQDNPDRPVHFARTTANYAVQLGFGDHVATHGLTRKLSRRPLVETDTMKRLPWDGWMDVAATSALWNGFTAPASLIRKNKWIDKPSASVPMSYVVAGIALSDSMILRGDIAGANEVFDRAKSIAGAAGVADILPANAAPPPVPLGDTTLARPAVPVVPQRGTNGGK
jgi:hypothetical protein